MRRDGKSTHKVALLAANISTGATKIYSFDGNGYTHALLVMSSTTLEQQRVSFKLQDSEDGTTFADVSPLVLAQIPVSTTAESRTILVNLNRVRRYVRAQYVFQGTDAANAKIYSVCAILQNQANALGQPFTVTL